MVMDDDLVLILRIPGALKPNVFYPKYTSLLSPFGKLSTFLPDRYVELELRKSNERPCSAHQKSR